MRKLLDIKNVESWHRSWTEAVPLGAAKVSVAIGEDECRAELKVSGEAFAGKGQSVVLALQDLAASVTKAAIKQQRRGRAPDRVRVAATLLQGGSK